jgi:CRISPR-associated protein Csm2
MTQAPKRINSSSQTMPISDEIVKTISGLKSLQEYSIRKLVEHAQVFGPDLKRQRLETNQVRKFLDALNQIKAKLSEVEEKLKPAFDKIDQSDASIDEKDKQKDQLRFQEIETEVVLLKPKLAYASARQDAVKPLNRVMDAAIDRVYSKPDFDRLVQLIESIIAYHKAEGGK